MVKKTFIRNLYVRLDLQDAYHAFLWGKTHQMREYLISAIQHLALDDKEDDPDGKRKLEKKESKDAEGKNILGFSEEMLNLKGTEYDIDRG